MALSVHQAASDLLAAKRLELIRDLTSTATLIGILMNRTDVSSRAYAKDIQEAASVVGQKIEILDVGSEDETDAAFAAFAQLHVGALIVVSDNFFVSRREQLVQLAARYVIPTIYENRDFTVAGGLMSYGASLVDVYRQVGVYVGRILLGTKPADLPVLQPTKFELVINVKTARALGLTIPPTLLARADEVIE